MTDDLSAPLGPLFKPLTGSYNPLTAGALTASLLYDVLALVADGPAQLRSYERGAAEVLTLGLGGSLVATALEAVEYLHAPEVDAKASSRFALGGALVAVYLLDVAARRKHSAEGHSTWSVGDAFPTGLSLAALTLLAILGKRGS